MTVNSQRLGSIARQVIAIAAVVMGALTASISSIHLPTGVSAALAAIGGVILAVEHYVSDPSTGTTTPPVVVPVVPPPTLPPVLPPQPAQVIGNPAPPEPTPQP